MCQICDNIESYNNLYPLGLVLESISVESLVAYFSIVNNIRDSCIEHIKDLSIEKFETKHLDVELDGFTNNISIAYNNWLYSQCFYTYWVGFKIKTDAEKKKLNEELKYIFLH